MNSEIFGPESALYEEYKNGDGYTNVFANYTTLYGMADVDVSKPKGDSAWTPARCTKEITDLRKELEPRLKLCMTATGRSNPTFFQQCAGQNALLLAGLYVVLRHDHVATSIFRPIFGRDMGSSGFDSLSEEEPSWSTLQVPTAPPPKSQRLGNIGTPIPAVPLNGAALDGIPPSSAIEAEELESARAARRAAQATELSQLAESGSKAMQMLDTILKLPVEQREGPMKLYTALFASIESQMTPSTPSASSGSSSAGSGSSSAGSSSQAGS